MPQGRAWSEDLCWTIVRMSPLFSSRQIAAYTGVSRRSVQRILALWRRTGNPRNIPMPWMRGRPRSMDIDDVEVCSEPVLE